MQPSKIFISTSSFAVHSNEPLDTLDKNKIKYILNPFKRKLNSKELLNCANNVHAIIAGTEMYDKQVLLNLPNLKVISRLGIGMDNIDMEVAKEKGIRVFKTTTTPAPAVAELVLGLMIDVSRHISRSNQLLKNNTWKKQMGSLLQRKTLGIIGLGVIGKALVKLINGFDFNILAFDQYEDKAFAKENDVTYCDLKTLLRDSDIVSIHLNLSDRTNKFIDSEKLRLMKPDAILLNASRGEIIDEDALYDILKERKIFGAGLDVYRNEPYTGQLTELDNLVLTPHIGSYAKEIRIKMEMEAAENLIRGLNAV